MDHAVSIWMWLGFSLFIVFALSVDTFNQKFIKPHESISAALWWSVVWVASACVFTVVIWIYYHLNFNNAIAHEKTLSFFTGYLIEKSLSLDNIFAFYMIFTQFKIPVKYQQRVFSYGIWSAIAMRLALILLGTWLVQHFHWILYVMGAFLLLTGIKIILFKEDDKELQHTLIFKTLQRFFRLTPKLHDEHFVVYQKGKLYLTPLIIALIFVEFSDLIFAFDSIPAIFAITTDPFIVWSSNIFAILGLRSLYFVIIHMIEKFHLLKYGMALILVFVGFKMLVAPWLNITILMSLGVIVGLLVLFAVLSSISLKSRKS